MQISLQENGPVVQLTAGLCNFWKVDPHSSAYADLYELWLSVFLGLHYY